MGFCPRCGKPTEHQFCIDCLRELHPLIKDVQHITVIMCPSCLRTYTNLWGRKPLQEILEKQLQRKIVFAPDSRIDSTILEQAAIEPGKQELELTVIGSADSEGESYEEYYVVAVLVEGRRCTECEKLANTYFTGILQLRRPNDTVRAEIERLLGRAMSDVKDVTGGTDYYVTDHRILQNVARQIHDQFGGELTIRAQHFSYDSLASKNLYRVNACIRLPKFWKGSVIQAATKRVFITSMGKRLKVIDLDTGKQLSIACKNDYQDYPLVKTSVVTSRPAVTVLHPETFQAVAVENSWVKLEPGEQVTVALIDERVYVVPA